MERDNVYTELWKQASDNVASQVSELVDKEYQRLLSTHKYRDIVIEIFNIASENLSDFSVKLSAIRVLRSAFKLGLKDARDAVDVLWVTESGKYRRRLPPREYRHDDEEF